MNDNEHFIQGLLIGMLTGAVLIFLVQLLILGLIILGY